VHAATFDSRTTISFGGSSAHRCALKGRRESRKRPGANARSHASVSSRIVNMEGKEGNVAASDYRATRKPGNASSCPLSGHEGDERSPSRGRQNRARLRLDLNSKSVYAVQTGVAIAGDKASSLGTASFAPRADNRLDNAVRARGEGSGAHSREYSSAFPCQVAGASARHSRGTRRNSTRATTTVIHQNQPSLAPSCPARAPRSPILLRKMRGDARVRN